MATSANYTSRFDIPYGLVSRDAKSEHPHAPYAARVFKAWRHKASEWKVKLKPHGLKAQASFLDDKTSFKIADPEEAGGEAVPPLDRNKRTGLLCRSSSRTYGRTGSMTRGSCAHVLLLRDVVICRANLTDIIAYHATQLGQLGEGREKGRQKGIEWPALDRRARDNGAKRATEGDPRKGVMTWGLAGATASGLAIKSPIWYRIRCARSGATIIGSSKTTCRSRQKSCNCITSNSK